MRTLTILFLIFSFFLSPVPCALAPARAAVPPTINFQGRLSDDADAPLSGSHSFVFSLYDAASGGNRLWNETQTLPVQEGIYNCQLGSVTPLNLAFDQPYYLEVTVDNNTLSPRQALCAGPYSLNAERLSGIPAANFLKADASGNVGIGTANPTTKLDVAGKIRGTAVYAKDVSTYPPPSTTSRNPVLTDSLKTTLTVQKDDIVMVLMSVNLRNASSGATTYMKPALSSGSASAVLSPNWITVTGSGWVAGTSIGMYKATADGAIEFKGQWLVSGGTGYHVYGNLVAWIIGKG